MILNPSELPTAEGFFLFSFIPKMYRLLSFFVSISFDFYCIYQF